MSPKPQNDIFCEVDVHSEEFLFRKKRKLELLAPLLSNIEDCQQTALFFDFITDELRQSYNIVETENVSAHEYDPIALGIITEYGSGLVLDCGSGKRLKYFDNVINLEVVPYESTDVLAVGEVLPFQDECFDAVLSLNVLEHVKDPFSAANEILRVLKTGGQLYSVTPFLQPVHAFPHHYYNMTAQGLANLFSPGLEVEKQEVIASGLPIWGLSSILNIWAAGLTEETREKFLSLKVSDLIGDPLSYLNSAFVSELSPEKNFEIACTTALLGKKK
jgi:SAM-dependent methyltransferase